MKLALILSLCAFSLSLFALDSDQEFKKCGVYEIGGKLKCLSGQKCIIEIGTDAQLKKEIIIEKSKYSLSYFNGSHILVNVDVLEKGIKVKGHLKTAPTQQVGAIKKSHSKIVKPGICQ